MKTISEVIRQVSSESSYDGEYRVGYPCDAFADIVIERLGAGEMLWVGDHYHCYIFYQGRFYDEDHPEGLDSPRHNRQPASESKKI